jgi:hypothetical protein
MPHSSAEMQIIGATRHSAAAALAGGIIAATCRPWSVAEALSLYHDVNFAMHPAPGEGHYEAWKTTRDERLSKMHE